MVKITVVGVGELFVVAARARTQADIWLFSLGWSPSGALSDLERKVRAHRLPPVEMSLHHSQQVGTALEEYLHLVGKSKDHGNGFQKLLQEVGSCLNSRECPYRWKEVYLQLVELPRGTLTTYKQLAKTAGVPVRSVVWAVAYNPYPIVIPCHRVVMSNGQPGGYTPLGTSFKRYLLCVEGVKNL